MRKKAQQIIHFKMLRNFVDKNRTSRLSVYVPTRPNKLLANISGSSSCNFTPLNLNIPKVIQPIFVDEDSDEEEEIEAPRHVIINAESTRIINLNQKETRNLHLPDLPPFPKPGSEFFRDVMISKLDLCSQLCDFENPSNDKSAKEIKTRTLNEIVNVFYAVGFNSNIPHDLKEKILEMIRINILRPCSKFQIKLFFNMDTTCITVEDWVHVSLVYKILLTFYGSFPSFFNNKLDFVKQS